MSNQIPFFKEMEKITGIPEERQIEIFEQVRQNRETLKSCDFHDFSIDLEPKSIFKKKFKCTRCGGIVDSNEKDWYECGLKHGRKGENL